MSLTRLFNMMHSVVVSPIQIITFTVIVILNLSWVGILVPFIAFGLISIQLVVAYQFM
jgi:hypothetical protein